MALPSSHNRDWRALWFALCFPTVFTLVYFVLLDGLPRAWQLSAYAAGKLVQFLFPAFWVVFVQREQPRFHRPRMRDLALGAGLGLALLAGLLILYHALKPAGFLDAVAGQVRNKLNALGFSTGPAFLGVAAFYVLCHSGLEEYCWRWFVFGQLRRLGTFSSAALISSLGFMAHHVVIVGFFFTWSTVTGILLTILASTAVAIGGLIWAWLYHRTGSLYAPWVSHAFMDAAIFVVGYEMIL